MILYVLGFAFNADLSRVLLILKNKPERQKGLLNGIGGKFESTDVLTDHAMSREFQEETGIVTDSKEWRYYIGMYGPNDSISAWMVHCFYTKLDDERFYSYKTTTDEAVITMGLDNFNPSACIENLAWLVPMARAYANNEINYKVSI